MQIEFPRQPGALRCTVPLLSMVARNTGVGASKLIDGHIGENDHSDQICYPRVNRLVVLRVLVDSARWVPGTAPYYVYPTGRGTMKCWGLTAGSWYDKIDHSDQPLPTGPADPSGAH
jgi:hypothetical protein